MKRAARLPTGPRTSEGGRPCKPAKILPAIRRKDLPVVHLPRQTRSQGGKTKLTNHRAAIILHAISCGCYRETAAELASIKAETLSHWMGWSGEPYETFQRLVRKAEAGLESRMVTILTGQAEVRPELALAILERKFPQRWAKVTVVAAPDTDESPAHLRRSQVAPCSPPGKSHPALCSPPRDAAVADPRGLRLESADADLGTGLAALEPCSGPSACVRCANARAGRAALTKEDPMADRIRDVMTPNPQTLSASATVREAAETMRTNDIGDVIASDDKGGIAGIVTDRDIVVRVVAEGRDPGATRIEDIASRDLTAVSPDDPVERAIELMRERAVRRLPVVKRGKVVGIVSIGDLAVERDPASALADISAAPPNL